MKIVVTSCAARQLYQYPADRPNFHAGKYVAEAAWQIRKSRYMLPLTGFFAERVE